ncbi:MAG: response regulator, partial [Dehalococcoidia bacterium]
MGRTMDTKPVILILDDDPAIRKTLSHIISAKGYSPMPAGSAKAALALAKEQTPAIALIDLKLEDASGLKAMSEIRKLCPGTECIVLTGQSTQESAVEAVNLGAYGYLQKPYDVKQLLAMIGRAIEKRQAEKDLRDREERFRRLVQDMHDGYFVVQDGRVAFANARSAEMFGYALEDVTWKTVQNLLPPEIAAELSKIHEGRRRGDDVPDQYEATLVGKDGTARPVEFGVRMIDYAGRPAVSVVVRDITDRK